MRVRNRLIPLVGVAAALCCAGPISGAAAKPKLPPIGHVFTIVLENKDYDKSFGPTSEAPYLANTVTSKGQLLTDYYGTGHASLGNYITLISGQSENPTTQADCGTFSDFTALAQAPFGQAVGAGCVYPTQYQTIADQLEKAGYTWRGYMEDMGDDLTRDGSATCSHPAIGAMDNTQRATATDQYATRHNPFMYFHSVIDDAASCNKHVVNLDKLTKDLKKPKKTPNYSFITPDLCADGHDATCADPSQPGGYAGIDEFLKTWVPRITKSKAFKRDGVLFVTFDESESDGTACCFTPTGPNALLQGIYGPGGGKTGTVVISPFTKAGSTNARTYNHYNMLHTVEDIFGLKHLGYAAEPSVNSFGKDVFAKKPKSHGTGGGHHH